MVFLKIPYSNMLRLYPWYTLGPYLPDDFSPAHYAKATTFWQLTPTTPLSYSIWNFQKDRNKKLLIHLKSQSSKHSSLQVNSSNNKIFLKVLISQFFPIPKVLHSVAKNAFQLIFSIKYIKAFRSLCALESLGLSG